MRQIRIFLSSPGDVVDERGRARRLIKDVLPVDPFIRGKVTLDVVSWDDPDAPATMPAHLPPQQAIERGLPLPSDCDIVVVALWSRFGTAPSAPHAKPDGTPFRSGTEWEYYDALNAARNKGAPSILVYRRTEPPTIALTAPEAQRQEALRQWGAVEEFFAQFQDKDGAALGGFHKYATPDEFERILVHHLKAEISLILEDASEAQPQAAAPGDGAFVAPRFANSVPREAAAFDLAEKQRAASILIITGLSGNGKSFLAAQFSDQLLAAGQARATLWIECEQNESLESLLVRVARKASIVAQTVKARCKELLAYLKREQAILFLDDYQVCNHTSMDPLLTLATSQDAPARVVLISRILPDEVVALPGVVVHPIADFTENEAARLIERRGGRSLDSAVLRDLVAKTGALPLAMALFCGLVSLGANPRMLLDGELLEAERIKRWFDELTGMLSSRAVRLLGFLSLVEGSFDEAVVQMFLSGTSESEIRKDFRSIQRVFLVERYDHDRWTVHDLVAQVGRLSLPRDIVNSVYAALGRHYRALAGESDSDGWFEYTIKACKALDRSGEQDDLLEEALSVLAPEIKRRGAHMVFLELSRNLIGGRNCSEPWLYYHFAHCCFVLGLHDEAMEYTRRILQTATRRNATLRLSASRLYSEALAAMGDDERAFENLNGALEAARGQKIERTNLLQAHSVLAGIETNLSRCGAAHDRIQKLMQEAENPYQPLGKAVALCRMGLLQLKLRTANDAARSFGEALGLFRDLQNPRGQAWALVGLAQSAIAAGDDAACLKYVQWAVVIQEEIGGYDRQYEEALATIRANGRLSMLRDVLAQEDIRVQQLKSERRALARRLRGLV